MTTPAVTTGVSAAELDLVECPAAAVMPLLRTVWGDKRDIAGEYPLLFDDPARGIRADGRFVALTVAGEPISACAYLERTLVTPFGELKLALLGSVATHPAWRGRGFATHVLGASEAIARASGCVATLLWPMDGRVYRGCGYRPAACEWNIVLPKELALGSAERIRNVQSGDAAALLHLYERHPVRVRRTAEQMARLLAGPGMDVRVATRGGEPIAYACRGRGGDLATCVHEWAGDTHAVLALASVFARDARLGDTPRYLIAPDWSNEVADALLDAGCRSGTRPLGMAKLANRAAACRFISARTSRELAATPCGALAIHPDGARGLTDAQLLAAILPPENQGPALQAAAFALGVEPADLPAYAFCWGLDSI